MRLCVCARLRSVSVLPLIPLRNQAASTLVLLTGPEGLTPIMQCSHYSVADCTLRTEGNICRLYLCVHVILGHVCSFGSFCEKAAMNSGQAGSAKDTQGHIMTL